MKIFVTGATGYIGGSVAAKMIAAGHQVSGLVRSEARATQARDKGITPVIGSLDDTDTLQAAVRDSDAVINAASADNRGAVEAIISALAGSDKKFVHTSGSNR